MALRFCRLLMSVVLRIFPQLTLVDLILEQLPHGFAQLTPGAELGTAQGCEAYSGMQLKKSR
jgi:hypothetical protein